MKFSEDHAHRLLYLCNESLKTASGRVVHANVGLTGLGILPSIAFKIRRCGEGPLGVAAGPASCSEGCKNVVANRLARLLLVGVAVMMVACATVAEQPAEEVVVRRAQMRWDALVAGQVEEAYGYLSPGSKAKWNLPEYKSRIGSGLWRGARVMRAECSADLCNVYVMVDFRYRRPGVNVVAETAVPETWVKEDGVWWYVPKR